MARIRVIASRWIDGKLLGGIEPEGVREDDANDRTNAYFTVLARLKRGVSIEDARAELRLIAAHRPGAIDRDAASPEISGLLSRLQDIAG